MKNRYPFVAKWNVQCVLSRMHGLVILCFLFLSPLLLHAQTPTREQLTGIWIGIHSELDTDDHCSLPTYIQLDSDSTYRLGMVDGSANPVTSTWAVHGETVRLDTIHYAPRLVRLENNLLRIGTTIPMVFRKFTNIPIDSASAYRQLVGRIWQSDSLIISLYANGRVSLENPVTHQRTTHFWRLARFGISVFLVIRGSQHNRESDYKPLWQVSYLAKNKVQAIGWNGRAVATETFQLVRNLAAGDSCKPTGFQTCDNCFRRRWHENASARGNKRYEITQLFAKYYQPVNCKGESGLIRIQFLLNCEGELGSVSIAGFGEDYCPKPFDSLITSQLMAICRNHVATDLALHTSDKSGIPVTQDVAVSLTFRFKDGRITEILP